MNKMANKLYFINIGLFFTLLLAMILDVLRYSTSHISLQVGIIIFLIILNMFYIFHYRMFYYFSTAFFVIVLLRSLLGFFIKSSMIAAIIPLVAFVGFFISLEELNLHMMSSRKRDYPMHETRSYAAKPEVKKKPYKINLEKYFGKVLADRKTGLVHSAECVFAKKILKSNLEVFNSEKEALKKYHPHSCLLP
jgi:hypothetical protein